jgi:hypothetical protein
VLGRGIDPAEYATHLLGVARLAVGHQRAWASAPAIAHPSTLERRISAMLTEKRNREPLTRRACVAAVTGIVAVALPITALAIGGAGQRTPALADVVLAPNPSPAIATVPSTAAAVVVPRMRDAAAAPAAAPAAQQAPATLAVIVLDPSGAVLPGVEATLIDVQAARRYSMVTDASGRFSIADLLPGRYEMVLSLPGFATVSNVMAVTAGADVRRTITLPLGSLEETIFVTCGTPAAGLSLPDSPIGADGQVAAARPAPRVVTRTRTWSAGSNQEQRASGVPVRVGGQIAVSSQIRKVNPVCPRTILPLADTVVVLTARIGVDGYLTDLREVPPAAGAAGPAQEFVDAALDAVRQWGYTPTRLNNVPVEANIRITVQFSR